MNILTGFSHLDDIIEGLRPGELTVIAGRPGIGKTTLCCFVADNIARSGKKVYFTEIYEMASTDPETGEKYDVVFFSALYPAGKRQAADIYGKLKAFAVAESIAVVVEAAADKKAERPDTCRPALEHIKYSAAVKKFADNILIVYREGYYDAAADKSVFEIITAKSSLGRLGTAMLKIEINDADCSRSKEK